MAVHIMVAHTLGARADGRGKYATIYENCTESVIFQGSLILFYPKNVTFF